MHASCDFKLLFKHKIGKQKPGLDDPIISRQRVRGDINISKDRHDPL